MTCTSVLRRAAVCLALAVPLMAAADVPGNLPPPPGTIPPESNEVPEPGTLLLAGLAIAGAIKARRRS